MAQTVTQPTSIEPKAERSLVGYLVAAGTLLLLLPILPFLAVLWIADRIAGDEEPTEL